MATDTYALEFIANIEKYQAELAKLPGYTDSKAASAAERLVRQMAKAQQTAARDAEKAASQSAKAWTAAAREASTAVGDRMTGGLERIEDRSGKASTALGALAQGLGTVNPKLGEMARVAGDGAGGLEGLLRVAKLSAPAIAAIGVAAAVAAPIWLKLRHEEQEATAAMEEAAATATMLQSSLSGLDGVVGELSDEWRVLTGETDQFGLVAEKRLASIQREFGKGRAAIEQLIEAQREHLAELQASTSAWNMNSAEIETARRRLDQLQDMLVRVSEREAEAKFQAEGLAELQREAGDAADYMAAKERANAEAVRETARAAAEEAKRLAELRQEMADFLAFAVEAKAELDFSADLAGMLPADRVVDPELVERLRDLQEQFDTLVPPEALEEVDQLRLLLLDLELQASSSEQAFQALAEPIVMVREKIEDIEKVRLQRTARQWSSALIASFQSMGDSLVTIMSNSGKRGVGAAYTLAKGLATVNVIFSTAQAVMAALGPPPTGLGPILGAPVAVAAGAAGALQIAAINSAPRPTAHSGGIAPDEVNYTLQGGERVIPAYARDRTGVDRMLDRIERGESMAGAAGTAELVLMDGHRVVGRAVARNLRKARTRARIQDAARTPGGWT